MRIGEVVRAIESRAGAAGPIVVAVDGPAASGKSTLARRLAGAMDAATVVEIDDFNSWSDPTGLRWWQRFDEQVLTPAFAGEPLRYQVRDWQHDEFGEALAGWRSVPAARIVVVEGVTSARAAVRERGGFTIWVEAPASRRLERAMARDGMSHRDIWLRWMRAEDAFFTADGTRSAADLRIDGDPAQPHDAATELVVI